MDRTAPEPYLIVLPDQAFVTAGGVKRTAAVD